MSLGMERYSTVRDEIYQILADYLDSEITKKDMEKMVKIKLSQLPKEEGLLYAN